MKVLLVRPPITLQVAQRLTPFLHLEPLALETVAGGISGRTSSGSQPFPIKVPRMDFARSMYHGMRYRLCVRNICIDYQGQQLPKRSGL